MPCVRIATGVWGAGSEMKLIEAVQSALVAAFRIPEGDRDVVLDLYGEKDFPAVLDHAGQRAAAIRGIRGSAQIQVPGADHFFAGMEGELVRRVRQFLDARLKP